MVTAFNAADSMSRQLSATVRTPSALARGAGMMAEAEHGPAAKRRDSTAHGAALTITHNFFASESNHSSGFGDSSYGGSPSALKGRAATARGKAPGLRRANTRCKPHRGALSTLAPRRSARPGGALRHLARVRVPGALPLAITAPHLRCYFRIPNDCSLLL